MSAPVTVVIPTYNGRPLLSKHLPSVEAILRARDVLLLVDDASTDDSVEWLIKRFSAEPIPTPQSLPTDAVLYEGGLKVGEETNPVLILSLKSNVRFAGAVNHAVSLVTTPTFLLLNNDVEPMPGLLDVLVPEFFNNKVFAIGCHEFENDEKTIEGGKNKLWFERGIFQHARADEFGSGETAWVSGGSGIFDTNKWQKLGGFDPQFYPAYWEDTDISMRARKFGWKTLFCAEAVVFHKHETSNASVFGSDTIVKLSWQHQRYFTRKHANIWQLLQYYMWQPYWRRKMGPWY